MKEFKAAIAAIPQEYDEQELWYCDVGGGPAKDVRFIPECTKHHKCDGAHIDDLG